MTSSSAPERNPVEALRDDHRRASRLIRLLTEQIEGVIRLRPLDIEIAQGVFRYMVDFVDHQHHAREDVLIELLAKRHPTAWQCIRQTNKEHDRLKQDGEDILAALATLLENPAIDGTALVRRLRHYGDMLLEHFHFEEIRLFSVAEVLLDEGGWRQIEKASVTSGDPLFGPEVEDGFESLFDIYVNHVHEIGTPASRHATASAAAFVDTTAAALSGSRSMYAALRLGAMKVFETNVTGASTLARSRSFSEFYGNMLNWSRSSFDEANAMSCQVFDAMQEATAAVVAPLGDALDSELREFDVAYRRDHSSTSLQAHLVNLALRATVKRMATSAAFDETDLPTKNIEMPRTGIDRFIPDLADDIEVSRMELDSAFAEAIAVKDAPASRTVLFLPGGGFMMAPTQAHRLMAARLARSAQAKVVLVHYRLAPEYRFPAGLDDCVEAYRYLLKDGTSPNSLVVLGDSAGGAMALSSLLRIRDEGLPLPAAGVLLSPVTDLSYSGASRRDNSWTDPSLPTDENNLITRVYLGDVPNDDPMASPLFADLSGLPPVLIQVGSTEILLDDALRVAAKIRAQGGECECEVWHDMPHDWILFGMLPEARKALRRVAEFIEEKLDQHAQVARTLQCHDG